MSRRNTSAESQTDWTAIDWAAVPDGSPKLKHAKALYVMLKEAGFPDDYLAAMRWLIDDATVREEEVYRTRVLVEDYRKLIVDTVEKLARLQPSAHGIREATPTEKQKFARHFYEPEKFIVDWIK